MTGCQTLTIALTTAADVCSSGKSARITPWRWPSAMTWRITPCSVSVKYKKDGKWEYGSYMKAADAIIAATLLEDAREYMMEMDAADDRPARERQTARTQEEHNGGDESDERPF